MGETVYYEYITELCTNCSWVQRKEPLAEGGWGLSEVTFEPGFKRAEGSTSPLPAPPPQVHRSPYKRGVAPGEAEMAGS